MRLWLIIWRLFDLAQAFHKVRAARMETAARWRRDQVGWLSRRHFLEGQGVPIVRVRGGLQQRLGVGMEGVPQQVVHLGLLRDPGRVHDKDPLREIAHRREVVRDIDHGQLVRFLQAAQQLEDLDPDFAKQVEPGDIIVAGRNWGCGSSREQAVTCLKESGVGAIMAASFARIYYRNCLNAALPALICAEAQDLLQPGERISIDLDRGVLHYDRGEIPFRPIPTSVREIFDAGGLIEYTRRRLSSKHT